VACGTAVAGGKQSGCARLLPGRPVITEIIIVDCYLPPAGSSDPRSFEEADG
jgi:hypothetical protein